MTSVVKPWLILTIIFVAGVATGVALTIALSSHFISPPGEAQMREHWMAGLVRRLDLTADQQAKIQPIVADATTKIQALHRDEIDHGSQIIKSADDKIAAILTPTQKAELQKMESEREKRFFGHMHPWGPGHEGPGVKHHFGGPDGHDPDDHSQDDVSQPPTPPPQNP